MILSEGNKLNQTFPFSAVVLHTQLVQKCSVGKHSGLKHVLIVIGEKTCAPGAANKDRVVEGLFQKSDSRVDNQKRSLFGFYLVFFFFC